MVVALVELYFVLGINKCELLFIYRYFRVSSALLLKSEFFLLLKMEARLVVLKTDHRCRPKAFMSSVNKQHKSGPLKMANLVIYYELNT